MLCIGACASSASRRGGGGAVDDREYEAGLRAFREARYRDALIHFGAHLETDDESAQSIAARAYRIKSHAALGDCVAARAELGDLVARGAAAPIVDDARADAATCRPEGGAALDERGAAGAMRAALIEGNGVEAVVFAARAGGELSPDERTRIEQTIDALSAAELERAWPLLAPRQWPAPRVAFRRAALAAHAGDAPLAASLAAEIADDALAARARALASELERRRQVDPRAVGVLLPLSGRFAAVGRELRVAIELAAAAQPDATLVFVDTAGDEARAAGAVTELVDTAHPILILGPVGERESSAAAARAAELGVPIALLSPAEGLADPSAGVVRLWSSGEERARAAARAVVRRGFEAPAIFTPADDVGRAQARAFADAARAAGADVVAYGEYDPTGTALEPDVKRFLGLDPATNERLRRHLRKRPKDGWKTFSPDVAFDLLFIPDAYDRAALIAAFLVYFNVELATGAPVDAAALRRKHGGRIPSSVQLLGSAGWHDPGLIVRGGTAVDGALVVVDFAADEGGELLSEPAAELVDRFRKKTGRAPSAAAAQAYDATRIALSARARAATDGGTRAAAARALSSATLDDGVCGAAAVDAAGELSRGVLFLRVDGGAFVIDESID